MLSGFRSMQILTVPSFLGVTTIPAHQGERDGNLGDDSKDSTCAHFTFTCLLSGSGTFLGVWRGKGVASGLRQM